MPNDWQPSIPHEAGHEVMHSCSPLPPTSKSQNLNVKYLISWQVGYPSMAKKALKPPIC